MQSVAQRPARTALAVVLLAVVALGTLPATQATARTPGQRYEQRLINDERRARDRRILRFDEELSVIARRHSRRMANQGQIFHNPYLVQQVGNRNWTRLGENVGVVSKLATLRASLDDLHDSFMASRPHRRNIVRPAFRRVGIGFVRSGGRVWVTLVFLG